MCSYRGAGGALVVMAKIWLKEGTFESQNKLRVKEEVYIGDRSIVFCWLPLGFTLQSPKLLDVV